MALEAVRFTDQQLQVCVELITPTMAAAILEQQQPGQNRTLRVRHVEKLSGDMRAGRWILNGETIKLASDGRVLDGQHRLSAIVKAGIAVRSVVVRNADVRSLSTIDAGIIRTGADNTKLAGYTEHIVRAAQANAVWRYRTGSLASGQGWSMSAPALLEMLSAEPDLERSLPLARRCKHLLPIGISGSMHYLMAAKDRTMADVFFDALAGGENIHRGDPVFALRQRLIQFRASRHLKPRSNMLAALVIKAWNATRAGRQMLVLKWNESEEFPAIQ